MIRLLGDTALTVAFVAAIWGVIAAVLGVRRNSPDLLWQAKAAAYTNFILLTIATLAMVIALVTHDFSVSYVAQVGSRATPLFFTVISLWGALEGSILFWGWVLALYVAVAVWRTPESHGPMYWYATATLLGVVVFFNLLLVGPATPFQLVSPVPADGPGPNPLLQNHWLMAIHPPLLYLGYVGLTVPFAFAIGSLLAGRSDEDWIRLTRRWTLTAWAFLSVAVMAGMWWAYEVLGWGGYWAWDPVENASFMPWLTATAFLHSVMVQERRGMLKLWNVSLIVATFLLTILGTFLTRSGILSSVHAFASGDIGYYFLAFIAVVLVFSLALVAGRSAELRSDGRLDSVASRETVFLLNNLLLTAFTFTVLLGTMFPLLAEAARGVRVSVGAPFFNMMTLPLCVMLLFLMGVGPGLPWRRASPEQVRSKFMASAMAFVVMAAVILAIGARSIYAVLAFGFAAFALTTNVGEFVTGARARMRAHGENALLALGRLIRGNQRRYGGYVAHIGVVILVVGIAASSTFKAETEATLRPGQTVTLQDVELRFDGLWARQEPQRFVVGADLVLLRNGRDHARMDPRMNFYPMSQEPVPTPAVRSRLRDVYINLMAFERDGSTATFHVILEPLVNWIWFGGIVIGLGAVISLWPMKSKRAGRRPARAPAQREVSGTGVGGEA